MNPRRQLKQRVETPHRAQVAALPVRVGANGLEVLLITSRETHRWIVPKGWPMKGRKDHQAAAQEALEEAGIAGRIHKHPIGAYTYAKRTGSTSEPCRVMVYRLDVETEVDSWRERDQRTRRWFSAAEAAERVLEPRLASIILAVADRSGRESVQAGEPADSVMTFEAEAFEANALEAETSEARGPAA